MSNANNRSKKVEPWYELNIDKVRDDVQRYEANPNNIVTSNAFQMVDFGKLVVNSRVLDKMDHIFSDEIAGKVEVIDQDQAGLCWICGGMTVCRRSIIKKLKLDDDFHLSLNYLLYWDKLEKANYFMNHIIQNRDSEFDSDKIRDVVDHPISDGGYWHTFADLVEKYGMVPDSVYRRRLPGKNTGSMNKLIKYKLREFAANMMSPNRVGDQTNAKPSLAEICDLKDAYLSSIVTILTQMLGPPMYPNTKFDWTYKTKKGTKNIVKDVTPTCFYEKHCFVDFKNFVPIVNDPRPRHPYGMMYEKDSTKQMVLYRNKTSANPHVSLNMPIDDMVVLIMKQIDSGIPIYFSCDIEKFANHRFNMLDMNIYDMGTPFDTSFTKMSKADRLDFSDSYACHIMSIVGYDVVGSADVSGNPTNKKRKVTEQPESESDSDSDSDNPEKCPDGPPCKRLKRNVELSLPMVKQSSSKKNEQSNKSSGSKEKLSKKHTRTHDFYRFNADKVVKFKVENSWGDIGDEDGFYVMTKEWFSMFGYEIIIDKKHLSEKQLRMLKKKPIMMKDSDPLSKPCDKIIVDVCRNKTNDVIV